MPEMVAQSALDFAAGQKDRRLWGRECGESDLPASWKQEDVRSGALSIQQKLPVQIFGIFAGRMERVKPLPRIRCHVPCNTGHAG